MGENGILALISGVEVATAINLLPPADKSTQDQTVDMPTLHHGLVRFYAQRQSVKHRKSAHVFWTIYRAEVIDPSAQADPDMFEVPKGQSIRY